MEKKKKSYFVTTNSFFCNLSFNICSAADTRASTSSVEHLKFLNFVCFFITNTLDLTIFLSFLINLAEFPSFADVSKSLDLLFFEVLICFPMIFNEFLDNFYYYLKGNFQLLEFFEKLFSGLGILLNYTEIPLDITTGS